MLAASLCQTYLDRITRNLMDGDFAAYADRVALPFHVEGAAGALMIETLAMLREGFEQYRDSLRSQQVTDLIRIVCTVERPDRTRMQCTYDTHVMRNGQRLLEPVRSTMHLIRQGGRWRTARVTNAMFSNPLISPPSRDAVFVRRTLPTD